MSRVPNRSRNKDGRWRKKRSDARKPREKKSEPVYCPRCRHYTLEKMCGKLGDNGERLWMCKRCGFKSIRREEKTEMKVLNLYAGIGGNRKLWDDVEVTAVEIDPKIAEIYQDFFPEDTVIITDAHQYLLDHFGEYDFIWSSPPCPSHSRIRRFTSVNHGQAKPIYPDMKLYEEILFLGSYFDGKWCVENVISFYDPLIRPQVVGRHYFWSNFMIKEKNNVKVTNISAGKIGDLQSRHGFDLSNYSGINKKTILRNCVEPELGRLILDCVRGNTQLTLLEVNNR